MPSVPAFRSALLVTATAALAACGGEGSPRGAEAEMPQDTFIKLIEREPLTEADLAGMAMTELVVELPWTRNTVGRDATPGAPATGIRSAEVAAHQGFDRVTFALDDSLTVPGYHMVLAEAGAALACGNETRELTAPRSLVVTFTSARAGAEGETWVPVRMGRTTAPRMSRAGVLCDQDGTVIWMAELAEGDQFRVLELRNPNRIAVDVR